MAGVFIALEGLDGSGKSTIARRLVDALRRQGREVIPCREPGGTPVGEQIRVVLLDRAAHGMRPETEALLFAAARAQLVGAIIQPALSRGAIVVADRFSDSSLAYQWGGRGLAREAIVNLQRFATAQTDPDLKLLLDLPVETALRRRFTQEDAVNRLDTETIEFHSRVRQAYHVLAAEDPARWRVIDAAQSEEKVWTDVWRAVNETGLLVTPSPAGVATPDGTERT